MNLLDRIRCGGIAGGLCVVIASAGLAPASAQAPANQAATPPCDAHAKAINVTDFGAKGDGKTDNFKAFEAAFAYASRCKVSQVHVASGTYAFVPDAPAHGLLLPSNISFYGDGVGKSVLKVADDKPNADYDSLLWVRNQDNVEIRGMTMVGPS
jgi:polygalacturonase